MKPSFYELPFQAIKVVLSDFQSIGENKNVLEQLAEKMLHKEFYLDVLDEVELDDETLLVEIMSIEGSSNVRNFPRSIYEIFHTDPIM